MTPLPSYFPRPQSLSSILGRAVQLPPGQADVSGGAGAGAERRREAPPKAAERGPAMSGDAMGRVIEVLRRLAGGEAGSAAMAAEARQVLSLLGASRPPAGEAGRVRLNIMA